MSNTISVPELDPVFNYTIVENGKGIGDIYVYLIKSEIAKFAIITYDNTSDEYAFAIQTLTSNSEFESVELVRNAEKACNNFSGDNPFSELYDDKEAMSKLAVILAEFFESD